ncbi:MAG: sulfopyruvate decarboxylase subunit alpha [Candidatus Heimdallarchaeota archaeon]|nr:sulfopyruvate decarboxylase subunit alpha [Candidatus Heimdallarchaeota archaeon]MCK4253571.1 sulfopyruvate decarboxylase subunit alpha [Candidatus Heimdallarchaeota archaeon]
MIDSADFLSYLTDNGFTFSTGVPCSYFRDLLLALEKDDRFTYLPATREDEAMGIATGYFLGGGRMFLIMQNSGLANIGDAITSLTQLYKIPLLIFVSYRGLEPDRDLPEHIIMGDVTKPVLDAYQIPYWAIEETNWKVVLDNALEVMEELSKPVCILVKKGVLSE